MTETLTRDQVLALLAQDGPLEIEFKDLECYDWEKLKLSSRTIYEMRESNMTFRIKPTPQRRLSATLANGEVVSWPEPVREAPKIGQEYFMVQHACDPLRQEFENQCQEVWE